MRLDKYLKVSRIIKRRTVANQACDTEHVEVNGKRAKASYDVKVGDVISVTYGERTLKFKVLDVREHVAKADAASMYEIISE
ncbi:MAG: RNA-binding S4 domain-containing protein [Ruminococcaceae bacterium]|nr:RNA-binding S4 domain-containing protein [Oscillospiraceae bacterium]